VVITAVDLGLPNADATEKRKEESPYLSFYKIENGFEHFTFKWLHNNVEVHIVVYKDTKKGVENIVDAMMVVEDQGMIVTIPYNKGIKTFENDRFLIKVDRNKMFLITKTLHEL